MTPWSAVGRVVRNSVRFSGRATRGEFWWWVLVLAIVLLIASAVQLALPLLYGREFIPSARGLLSVFLVTGVAIWLVTFLPNNGCRRAEAARHRQERLVGAVVVRSSRTVLAGLGCCLFGHAGPGVWRGRPVGGPLLRHVGTELGGQRSRDRLGGAVAGWPLKPGGVLLATAINRFTSLLSGLANGFIDDAPFVSILRCDLGWALHISSRVGE